MNLLLLAACSDYAVDVHTKDRAQFDSGDTPDTVVDTDPTPAPEEACNGVDDDGDGAVDEGFPDSDGDGTADCVDTTCLDLVIGAAGPVSIEPECEVGPTTPSSLVTDAFDVRVKWGLPADGASLYASSITPIVGNFDDDDGDGDVDTDDTPEVILVGGELIYALDGRDGSLEWELPDVGFAPPVLADVDADGFPDLVYLASDGTVVAIDGTLTEIWRSTAVPNGVAEPYATDLDGDGRPEVVVGDAVLDGGTGALEFTLPVAAPWGSFVGGTSADLDGDGQEEIYRAGTLYESDGTPRFSIGALGMSNDWPLVVQADADDDGELAVAGDALSIYDPDGTLVASSAPFWTGAGGAGAPCAADFDGDGAMEVAVPVYDLHESRMNLYEMDGTLAWSTAGPGRTLMAGCSGFDFDGDGALEIVYAADEAFYIFDGSTGDILLTYADHASPTLWEYATVADVDHDDHAEIVFVSLGRADLPYYVTVLAHAGDGWPSAGTSWSDVTFHMTGVDESGAVPAIQAPAWLGYGVFRARTAITPTPPRPDLEIAFTDVCVADCDVGPVEVALQVANHGAVGVPAGTEVTVYAVDEAVEWDVATVTLPYVPAGESLDGITIELSIDDLGSLGFRAVVDGSGNLDECDEGDDEATWSETFCP